jgi:SRSO17 transposase
MAAKLDPTRLRARHQALHHFVASSAWDAKAVLAVARDYALEQLERHGPVEAWVVDDTGFPKKGTHSVGVVRQYCGPLGKQDNCQVAVTLSLCSSVMSVPSAYRLYLPESWAGDAARRKAAGIPAQVRFQPKWEIALSHVDTLLEEQLPLAPMVADAGYGEVTKFREALTARGIAFLSSARLPQDFQVRGAAATTPRAPQPGVHHHPTSPSGAHAPPATPLLPVVRGRARQSLMFMTQ